MLPVIKNNINGGVTSYKKTFAETLCEGYRFEIKHDKRNAGVRSVYYYREEHSLLVSHVFSSRVHVLNLATGKLRWFDHHGTTVRSVQICNNEIVTASWDGTVCITGFNSLDQRLILTEKEMGRCPYAAISPDNKSIYSYTYDSDKNPGRTSNTIRRWSITDGRLINLLQLPGVHLSSRRCGSCEVYNNRLFVVSDTGHLHIFDCDTGILLAEDFYNDQLQSLCLIPSSNLLAMAGSEGAIYLCDLSGRRITSKTNVHQHDVSQLIVHPDKPDIIISISFDRTVKIWKLPDLELLESVNVKGVSLWSVTAADDLIITGGEDGDIWIYDIKNLSDAVLKGKLVLSDDSYAFLPAEPNSFYASNFAMIRVRKIDDGIPEEGPFAEYLLNTACNFKLFKDLFCSEGNNNNELKEGTRGFYQITQ
jgi:WD40 repeat protein